MLPKTHPRLWFWLMSGCAFVLSGALGVCADNAFKMEDTAENVMLLVGAICSGLAMAGAVWLAVRAYLRLERPIKADPIVFALFAALWSYWLSELCMEAFVIKLYPLYNIMGYAIYAGVFLLGAVIFKRPKVWFCVWEVLFAIYSVAQYYLTQFRGAPVKFTDFDNLRSAMEVKSEYKLTLSFTIACVLFQIGGMLFITIRSSLCSESKKPRLITLGAVAAASAAFLLVSRWSYDYGVNNRIIKLNFSGDEDSYTSRRVGSLLMFYYDGVYNHVIVPDGYSDEKAEELISQYPVQSAEKKTPVVIGILNESFADYAHIKEFSTNKDYLPVYHSLEENTVKGFVTVSPYGGYTCNSEYEFLTGNTMHFLPLGSAVYTNYLKGDQDSIVTAMNDLGFVTTAVSPCNPELWDIGYAYDYLGFDVKYIGENKAWPEGEEINSQISDSRLFEKVCELADGRDKSKGAFYWVTTMQNHAPYNVDVEGGVELTDIEDQSAERYLNSIYQSDKAFGELVEHFKDYDEEVIIVMFGDHYPHIPSFHEELYGSSLAGLNAQEYSLIHQTPYIIWSNRTLGIGKHEDISLNYLGTEMFKAAGLPLTQVQQELESIRGELPIVSGFACRTSDGEWHATGDDLGGYEDKLKEYSIIQYYRMFSKNKKQ
ncbi:MAG: LTA synthase family protein [Ruminococcus sp.]|nr:LTA synthase family protein [Ruminococcus sp.]